ncbi:hypothetical protein ACQP2F_35445 [Actinoplanes sp. CA-030573]|uniref:hypothetical protein n=1 Tax=Actinoplanes sp. CA-030573 TaxID=3239898 RepID=UPI003D8E0443
MSGVAWTGGSSALERRYRRLLLAYPGRYRRGHGAEIVTTLMELADDGQTRPGVSDAWHLVASGIRQRFRLPGRRPLALVAAVLITVIGGAFGAAAGSWVAEQTFTGLPGDARVAALTRQVADSDRDFSMVRSTSPWWTGNVLGVADAPGWTPEAARARLAADGWQVGSIEDRDGAAYEQRADGTMVRVSSRGSEFEAARDGLRMQVTGYVSAEHGTVSIMLWPGGTGALRPAMTAGIVIGLVGGWLIAAAGAYRVRALPPGRRRVAVALTTASIAALATPAFAFWVNVMRVLHAHGSIVNTVHSALNATPYWSYATPWMLLVLTIAGLALAATAWAVTMRRPWAEPAVDQIPTTH